MNAKGLAHCSKDKLKSEYRTGVQVPSWINLDRAGWSRQPDETVSWWLMNKWLLAYAYRINIEWWVFGLSGAANIFIPLLTVCFQAIKAAMANPVKSLRTQ
jgi:hypothetical protein